MMNIRELTHHSYVRKGLSHLLSVAVLATCSVAFFGCPSVVVPPGTPPTDVDNPPIVTAPATGINVTVSSVTIPADLRPVINFSAVDDQGNVIPKSEITDVRFILDYLNPNPPQGDSARFVSYTQQTKTPSGGGAPFTQNIVDSARLAGLTQNADGTYTYKFAMAIMSNYPASATHQLGGQLKRQDVIDGKVYKTDVIYDFVPDGSPVTQTRQIVATQNCNICHTRLSVHGDIRREVQYCILCHNPQNHDNSGTQTLDFSWMIHKIHDGANLPSVQAGQPNIVNGQDFSDVVFPQDIRNCTICHQNAPQAGNYLTQPGLSPCTACHDRTWFGDIDKTPAGYTNHPGGMQTDDHMCALCHTPDSPGAAPIAVAHELPEDSAGATGLAFGITKVTPIPPATSGAGTAVKITFTVADGAGNPITDLSALDNIQCILGGPTSDYTFGVSENPKGAASLVNHGDGSYDYTFTRTLPSDSTDTFAVGMAGRIKYTFRGQTEEEGPSSNGVTYFTLDGSTPVPRRTVVLNANCNKCHKSLHMHGETRMGVELCVICHNADATDVSERPAGSTPETIHFDVMIHKIHTGENLTQPYTIYGYNNSVNDFTKIVFPGDRSQCVICHKPGTQDVPLPSEALPTEVDNADGTVASIKEPTRAACTACHDDLPADVHTLMQTSSDGVESCEVCHENTASFAVETVHKQTP